MLSRKGTGLWKLPWSHADSIRMSRGKLEVSFAQDRADSGWEGVGRRCFAEFLGVGLRGLGQLAIHLDS
jgi:hypothetical protein